MGGSPTHSSLLHTAGNAADAQSHRDEYESSREPPDCLKCLCKSKKKSPCRKTVTARAAAVQRAVAGLLYLTARRAQRLRDADGLLGGFPAQLS